VDVGDSSRTVPRQGEDASKILNLAHRIDRLPRTSYQNILLLIIATAWFVDTIDLSTLTFALDPISNTFSLSEGQAGLLVSMGFAGMAIGATSSGALADRFGRKAIFQYSMITWGIASLLLAFSWSFYSLLAFRFLLGIGMGAEYPVAQSLLGEITATKTRGKAIAWVSNLIGGPCAYVAAGLLALLMLSISGWRALFVVEAFLALFALVVRRGVPESPRWLESQGRIEEAGATIGYIEGRTEEAYGRPLPEPEPPSFTERVASKVGFSELLTSRYLRRAVMAWILWLCVVGGFYSVQSWIGKLLADQGFAIIESTQFVLLMVLWGIPGVITAGLLLDRIGRKTTLCLFVAGSAVAAFFYGQAETITWLLVAGSIMQFCFFGMWGSLYAYTAEIFPTSARATGAGSASTCGRIGAVVGPLIVPLVLGAYGVSGVFLIMVVVPFTIAVATVLILGPETRGKALEEVSS
jgi:MFS transporter, putative metabolite:H+ symporter